MEWNSVQCDAIQYNPIQNLLNAIILLEYARPTSEEHSPKDPPV